MTYARVIKFNPGKNDTRQLLMPPNITHVTPTSVSNNLTSRTTSMRETLLSSLFLFSFISYFSITWFFKVIILTLNYWRFKTRDFEKYDFFLNSRRMNNFNRNNYYYNLLKL